MLTRAFLYNPGLVTLVRGDGVLGLLLILNGSIVAVGGDGEGARSGHHRTIVMSPAGTSEIIIAKIAPLFFLLMLMVIFATRFMKVAFNVPFHGIACCVLRRVAVHACPASRWAR